jgi:alcohol dehydrogenase class IV
MAEIADAMKIETAGLVEDEKASAAIDAVAGLFKSIGIPTPSRISVWHRTNWLS